MVLGGELAVVLALCLPGCQLGGYHCRKKLLGLDEGNLDIAVRVAVEAELALDILRKGFKNSKILRSDVALHESYLLVLRREDAGLAGCRVGEDFVEFCDKLLDRRDELDDSLRNEDGTEVVSCCGTFCNDFGDVGDHIVKRHILCLDFLADKADVRLGLESALKGDVRCAAAHELDEVPVLAGGVAVTLDVADQFGICLAGCVETE